MTTEKIKSSLKSMDTEEWIDLAFYRPIGYQWAKLFHKLGVTPNAITVASIFLGMGAGVCFYFPNFWINLVGVFLLIWANMYDSTDGQLARMTNQKSELGRILDGVAGDLWFVTIYTAICLRLTPEWGIWIWILGAVSGELHSKQACIADYYRNIHLYFLKGKGGSEFDRLSDTKKIYSELSWSKFIPKLFYWFYRNYMYTQESMTPKFQKMYALMMEKYPDGVAPEKFRSEFRRLSLPLMKYTNILTFNTRAIVLCLSVLVGLPWIYFVFELTVLTGIWIYMIVRHERLSKQMYVLLNEKER